MAGRSLPDDILAADWSARLQGRAVARARRRGGRYVVGAPRRPGPEGLIRSLLDGPRGTGRLIGLDVPIGLPRRYAQRAGIATFRDGLACFGRGRWAEFYDVSAAPTVYRPFYPPPTRQRGVHSRDALVRGLGVEGFDALLRDCDRRAKAQSVFLTVGGKQVGRAAIAAWRDELAPNARQLALWPFDGDLPELLGRGGLVVAEVYPGEACRRLGLRIGAGTGRSKRRRDDRRAVVPELFAALEDLPAELDQDARAWLADGGESDDGFDAFVALVLMIGIACGQRVAPAPSAAHVRTVEGWILGQQR